MLRLDPAFNADLPESKRWLKEYGARENEAFRKYPVPPTEKERRRALESATKFLVVRHPVDRLVSSYLDKVRQSDSGGVKDRASLTQVVSGCRHQQRTKPSQAPRCEELHPGECWEKT